MNGPLFRWPTKQVCIKHPCTQNLSSSPTGLYLLLICVSMLNFPLLPKNEHIYYFRLTKPFFIQNFVNATQESYLKYHFGKSYVCLLMNKLLFLLSITVLPR